MRVVSACIGFLFSALALITPAHGIGAANKDLSKPSIVVADTDWAPFFFAGRVWTQDGLAKEVLKRCIPEAGFQPQFMFIPVGRLKQNVTEGMVDINVYGHNPERDAFVTYGKESVFESTYRAFIRNDATFDVEHSVDFKPLKVGHLNGLNYWPEYRTVIKSKTDMGEVHTVKRDEELVHALVNGDVDVVVASSTTFHWHAQQLGLGHKVKATTYGSDSRAYFMTLSKSSEIVKDHAAFLHSTDQCIRNMKESGEYNEIESRYYSHYYAITQAPF
ncbi:transporter substrate-binding domain-containing protein [Aestuariibacter sp. AA17]|uniref:Transporter substrate-binding domain-containing protein n=1 Tax=Fluctibacter corallii TaxID=2984329 RepID=A0ABT3ACH5_9ALTE|nr:transporter substrate-binding domain-containing protein [Aestuariibacter sp. AA17]MCV2886386.1 transporter substrate-binding domain-containing protein [Aestuariibacter sp. AA17]